MIIKFPPCWRTVINCSPRTQVTSIEPCVVRHSVRNRTQGFSSGDHGQKDFLGSVWLARINFEIHRGLTECYFSICCRRSTKLARGKLGCPSHDVLMNFGNLGPDEIPQQSLEVAEDLRAWMVYKTDIKSVFLTLCMSAIFSTDYFVAGDGFSSSHEC
jgi:hypothetical protein